MNGPHGASATREQNKKTSLGYRTFHCSACHRTFNERTGTAFNFLEYPTDIVLLIGLFLTKQASTFSQEKAAMVHHRSLLSQL